MSWSCSREGPGRPVGLGAADVLVVDRELAHVERLGHRRPGHAADHGGGPDRTRSTTVGVRRRRRGAGPPPGGSRRRAVRPCRRPRRRSPPARPAGGRGRRGGRPGGRWSTRRSRWGRRGRASPAARRAPRAHGRRTAGKRTSSPEVTHAGSAPCIPAAVSSPNDRVASETRRIDVLPLPAVAPEESPWPAAETPSSGAVSDTSGGRSASSRGCSPSPSSPAASTAR